MVEIPMFKTLIYQWEWECQHKVLGIYNYIGTHGISIGNIWEWMGIHDNTGKSSMGNPQIMSIFRYFHGSIYPMFIWDPPGSTIYGNWHEEPVYVGNDGQIPAWKWKLLESCGKMMENEVIIGHGSLLWIKHYHMSYLNSKWLFGGGASFKHAWRWSRKGASWPWWARVTDTWYNIRVVFQPIVGDILIDDQPLNHIMMPIPWSSN